MSEFNPTLRPSALDVLSQCSQYESQGNTQWTDAGTNRHEAIQAYYESFGDPSSIGHLPLDDQESVKWAWDQVNMLTPLEFNEPIFEQYLTFDTDEYKPWLPNGGTVDIQIGDYVVDIKSRPRSYYYQMLAYACLIFDNRPELTHLTFLLLFTQTRSTARMKFTRSEAFEKLGTVVNSILNDGSYNRCDYCGWCAKVLTCPEYLNPVKGLYKSFNGTEAEFLKDPSTIDTPDGLGDLREFAKVVETWSKAALDYTNEKALVEGIVPRGFKIIEKAGSRFINSVIGAYEHSRIDARDFIDLCKVGLGDIVKHYQEKFELTKKDAEAAVENDIGDFISQGKPTQYLRQIPKKKAK